MAVSFMIRSGEKLFYSSSFVSSHKSDQIFSPNPFLLPIPQKRTPKQHIVSASLNSPPLVIDGGSHRKDVIFPEKIDSWMQKSVPDIVKNLKQAPLLVRVFSEDSNDGEDGHIEFQTEKAVFENWPVLESEWGSGESKSPDGLIFVGELEQDCSDGDVADSIEQGVGVTRAWGIVVQSKGVDCRPSCYLLKTNKVCAGVGLGFCTHFCLMKVNNFRDSALEQFKNSWLLQ